MTGSWNRWKQSADVTFLFRAYARQIIDNNSRNIFQARCYPVCRHCGEPALLFDQWGWQCADCYFLTTILDIRHDAPMVAFHALERGIV